MSTKIGTTRLAPKSTDPEHIVFIRQKAVDLINEIESWMHPKDYTEDQAQEWRRLKALAFTNIQQGVLWAIEAGTK